MENVNGIQTPFDNYVCPCPTPGGGKGVTDVGGVSVPEGQKGVSGEMPEVSGVTLPNDKSPGTGRPDIAGS